MSFTNVLIQNARYHQFDENGYMIFYSVDSGREGYYITGGKAIPVTWEKTSDTDPTRYYDKDDNEITINTGKTCLLYTSHFQISDKEVFNYVDCRSMERL